MKIANAQGFWGDSPHAALQLIQKDPLIDYITFDYLAEVSLSIMALQRQKDPELGYAADFIEVAEEMAPYNVKLITNAGGLNPHGLAERLAKTGKKIAVVTGDDVLNNPHLKKSHPFITANAYLGADCVAKALSLGADIVITGRVADPSLTVAACLHHFSWELSDYTRIAGATVAGHLIECGRQATGGIFTDWFGKSSFPIIEIDADSAFTLYDTSIPIVKEQLLYEIGDPARYISPDAVVSFLTIQLAKTKEGVRISGATGSAPPDTYKVSATYKAGFKTEAMLVLVGDDLRNNAKKAVEEILGRLVKPPKRVHMECIGLGDVAPGLALKVPPKECMLRVALSDEEKEPLEAFGREWASLVTSGPAGTTGYATGRPKIRPLFAYYPTLIEKKYVCPEVNL